MATPTPIVQRMEPRAARYLDLLVEFGHLEPREVEQVIFAAAESWPSPGPIPLSAIRRVAAAMLVGEDESIDGTDILAADWPLLFH